MSTRPLLKLTIPAKPESLLERMRDNVLISGSPSPRTEQLLRRFDLDGTFRRDPEVVLRSIGRLVVERPDPDAVFALSELCFLTGQRAERFGKRDEALSLYGGSIVYAYLYLFDEKVGALVLLDVTGRVARLLLELSDDSGGDRITRRLTHHTIAQMVGSSRETVSRTMRDFVSKGHIAVNRREIQILDRAALGQAAGRS